MNGELDSWLNQPISPRGFSLCFALVPPAHLIAPLPEFPELSHSDSGLAFRSVIQGYTYRRGVSTVTKTKASAAMFLLLGLLGLVVACALFPTIDVTGAWTGLLAWAEGDPLAGFTSPITLVLVQEEKIITGEIQLAGGSTSFTLTINSGKAQGQSFTI
ncbi:unnamed protein product, partial [marine sediment metagenome]